MNNTQSNVVSINYIIVVNYVSAIKMYNLYEIIIGTTKGSIIYNIIRKYIISLGTLNCVK